MTKVSNGDYKNNYDIIEPPMLEESNDFIDITKKDKRIITYNRSLDLLLSPHSKIYYILKNCLETKYDDGMITRLGVKTHRTNSHYYKDTLEYKPKSDIQKIHPDYNFPNHANDLIIDTKNKQAIEVYIFDMNYSQGIHIRNLINRALEKCEIYYNQNHENKIKFMRHPGPDNKQYLVKVITGETLGLPSPRINIHSTFEYVKGGICGSIAYYVLILWSKYNFIFGSFPNLIKYIYDIIENSKKYSAQITDDIIQRRKEKDKEKINYKIAKERKEHQKAKNKRNKYAYLWDDLESGVLTFMIFSRDLFSNKMIEEYISTKTKESIKMQKKGFNKMLKEGYSIGGGKRTRKTKKVRKVRKHRGIVQTGGNKGKLKKGYKYTGKRLKNGSAEIKKVKAKK